ncbi:STAS domain-containing protein [Halochromatium salexigens]|uniref:STAS domain-containing protein n=1 Tax=Halochromatium salexigens TaxID=49447 RepID=A0AAJ0UH57_HALSE|nr:STAS domain-containing protein [Halochromatium salexigens]MBK5931392.1 hypothetical protein [Halochromatium salexigens]
MTMQHTQLLQESNSIRAILREDLTASTVPSLQSQLKDALKQDVRDITFDFQQARSIDSTGIGLLLAAKNSLAAQQGHLRLINVPNGMFSLFKSMRLIDSLNVEAQGNTPDVQGNDTESELEQAFEQAQAA